MERLKPKTELVLVRLTPEQKNAAERLAESCNMKVPELIRQLLAQAKAEPVIGYEAKL